MLVIRRVAAAELAAGLQQCNILIHHNGLSVHAPNVSKNRFWTRRRRPPDRDTTADLLSSVTNKRWRMGTFQGRLRLQRLRALARA